MYNPNPNSNPSTPYTPENYSVNTPYPASAFIPPPKENKPKPSFIRIATLIGVWVLIALFLLNPTITYISKHDITSNNSTITTPNTNYSESTINPLVFTVKNIPNCDNHGCVGKIQLVISNITDSRITNISVKPLNVHNFSYSSNPITVPSEIEAHNKVLLEAETTPNTSFLNIKYEFNNTSMSQLVIINTDSKLVFIQLIQE